MRGNSAGWCLCALAPLYCRHVLGVSGKVFLFWEVGGWSGSVIRCKSGWGVDSRSMLVG